MATVQTERMTAEQFADWASMPEQANGWYELVRGEVIELPPPTRKHGIVTIRIGSRLETYLERTGLGYAASNDSGVILERDPDTVRGPDVAVYNDANTFDEVHPKYGETVPLLAVEVLSPDDRAMAVARKVGDYLRAGVKVVWVVDYENRTIAAHRSDGVQRFTSADTLTAEDILPGFAVPLADLFRLPNERASAQRV